MYCMPWTHYINGGATKSYDLPLLCSVFNNDHGIPLGKGFSLLSLEDNFDPRDYEKKRIKVVIIDDEPSRVEDPKSFKDGSHLNGQALGNASKARDPNTLKKHPRNLDAATPSSSTYAPHATG